jgi:hypothetical protein
MIDDDDELELELDEDELENYINNAAPEYDESVADAFDYLQKLRQTCDVDQFSITENRDVVAVQIQFGRRDIRLDS